MTQVTLTKIELNADYNGDVNIIIPKLEGFIHQVRYIPRLGNPILANADIRIMGDKTGIEYVQAKLPSDARDMFPRQEVADQLVTKAVAEQLRIIVHGAGPLTEGTLYLWVV